MSDKQNNADQIIDMQYWRDEFKHRDQLRQIECGELVLTDRELLNKGYSQEQVDAIQRCL
jgi:hypothetical protein